VRLHRDDDKEGPVKFVEVMSDADQMIWLLIVLYPPLSPLPGGDFKLLGKVLSKEHRYLSIRRADWAAPVRHSLAEQAWVRRQTRNPCRKNLDSSLRSVWRGNYV
jgi:hypothetical protein